MSRQRLLIFCLKRFTILAHIFAAGCRVTGRKMLFQTWQAHVLNHFTQFGLKIAHVPNHCKFLRHKCLIFLVNAIQPLFANRVRIVNRFIGSELIQAQFQMINDAYSDFNFIGIIFCLVNVNQHVAIVNINFKIFLVCNAIILGKKQSAAILLFHIVQEFLHFFLNHIFIPIFIFNQNAWSVFSSDDNVSRFFRGSHRINLRTGIKRDKRVE